MAAPIGPVRLYRSKYGTPNAPVAPRSTTPGQVRYYKPKYAAPLAPRSAPPEIEQDAMDVVSRMPPVDDYGDVDLGIGTVGMDTAPNRFISDSALSLSRGAIGAGEAVVGLTDIATDIYCN